MLVRLIELEPKWIQWRKEPVDPDQFIDGARHPTGYRIIIPYVELMSEAHGIVFICPLCVDKDHHSVVCWFEGRVPDEAQPSPGRWTPSGTGFNDLTFVPGEKIKATSVQLLGGCNWHGFINNGEAT